MGLRDIGDTLPPGFRFYPSDEELVCHYLYNKISNNNQNSNTNNNNSNNNVCKGTLIEVDLHTCEPWQLPEVAKLNSSEWYFFSFRDRKYATGFRTNRATITGYWKATGKDRTITDPTTRSIVGMRKTLVFYKNRAPNGIKTGWIMHEFRLENPNNPPKEDWVLCRVFHKSKSETTATAAYYMSANCGGDKMSPPSMAASPLPPPFSGHPPPNQTQTTSIGTCNNLFHVAMPQPSNEYGFLFDMNFDDDQPNINNNQDMGFDDDNGLVFI